MKKYAKYYQIIWIILFVLFNVVVFAVPRETEVNGITLYKYSGSFWPGYIGILIAFIGNYSATRYFFEHCDSPAKTFLNMPVMTISWGALIVTMLVGSLTMLIWDLPNWLGAAFCLLVLLIYTFAIIKALAAAEAVEEIGKEVKEKTSAMKLMIADAETLVNKSDNGEIKDACRKVYEAMRYSDPMSNDALQSIETRIENTLYDFTKAANFGDVEKVKALATEILDLVQDRAVKCRMLK